MVYTRRSDSLTPKGGADIRGYANALDMRHERHRKRFDKSLNPNSYGYRVRGARMNERRGVEVEESHRELDPDLHARATQC